MEHKRQLEFFATTAKGMEPLLALELKEIGVEDLTEVRAGVKFKGLLEMGYRACLYSRIANRILLLLKTVPAYDAEELYTGIRSICWSDHLTTKHTLAVDFLASKAKFSKNVNITHTHFGSLKVKDAIVDQFRSQLKERPSIDPINPDLRVNVYLHKDEATVSIDLSGESLHKRGYRREGAEAPLKENLAAAILMLCEWTKKEDFSFLDPMCGSGTLPIEAALMKAQIAPGLLRKSFGFLRWLGHVPNLWERLLKEAREKVVSDRTRLPIIVGYDKDPEAIRVALSNLEKAGLSKFVTFEEKTLLECEPIGHHGILVTNPPYGERIGEIEQLKSLYKQLGDLMKQKFKGFEAYVFTGNQELAKSIGLKASRRFVLYNGSIECRLLKYELY